MSIDECVQDALFLLSPQSFDIGGIIQTNTALSQNECDIYAWPQTWDSTDCGHFFNHSCGLSSITKALAVVVVGPMMDACVYHGGKLAYIVKHVNDHFLTKIKQHDLPADPNVAKQFEKEINAHIRRGKPHRLMN